jgi:type IV pilus assembly protein PilY1
MTLHRTRALFARLLLACLAITGLARAADTDIASAPLFTSSNSLVKPNILFILDDSGSMAWDYLPDVANFSSTKYGKKTAQCNGVAYNPDIVYSPPRNADGTTQANASLSVITSVSDPTTQTTSQRSLSGTITMPATMTGTISVTVTGSNMTSSTYQQEQSVTIFNNGDSSRFFTGSVVSWTLSNSSTGTLVIDLSEGFNEGTGTFSSPRVGKGVPSSPIYYRYTGTQKALSYTYTSSGVITSTTFYRECNSAIGSDPGASVFTAVSVTASSTEAQNYANWYTYYRTRMLMTKAGISRAFVGLDNRYRIGYTTINERTATPGTNFLDVSDFDTTQKSSFYSRLFDADPGSNTPLRGALSKAGQYFANKARGQTTDPVQYSCQRNFAILSTDGYWNTGSESTSAPKYGPYKLDNITTVGQQDGSGTLRPMLDGETATSTTYETWTVTQVVTRRNETPTVTSTISGGTATLTITDSNGTSVYGTYNRLVRSFTADNGEMSHSGGVVTVDGIEHNLATGDLITVTGGSNSTLRATNVPITRISATRFTYPAPSASGSVGGSDYTFTPAMSAACSSGRGMRRQFIRLSNVTYSITRTASTTTSTQTATTVIEETTRTPYTRTVVSSDGVVSSDQTTTGTPVTSSTTLSSTVANGTPVTSSQVVTTNGSETANSLTLLEGVVVSTGTTCENSTPNDTSNGLSNGNSASMTVTVPGSTTVTPGGTVSTTLSSNTTESTRVTSAPSSNTSGGASNTLADVAMYYYMTDLRDSALNNCTGALGGNVCLNNVPGNTANAQRSFGDSAAWQHMTTFTLGLGVSGTLNFDPNYLTQTSGDFISILNRTKNWPAPSSGGVETIDDLWHAAVNGRGQYFSAGDPTSLANALTSALDSIKAITGAAAAASTSSLQPVEGDNDVFVAQFTSVKWIGDVLSYRIDPDVGTISTTAAWSAKAQLDAKDPATRSIYYPKSGALRAFTYANLTTDGFNSHFDGFCNKIGASGSGAPSQCASISDGDKALANAGANLVSYLRGTQTLSYYRPRDSRLGDIISASPLFVGKPAFKYTENNYQQFVTDNANRTAVVLSAANDGMLHAFSRATGEELWAFMPSFVLPNLYKLADNNYSNYHSYFVDGSPQVGDVYVPSGPYQGWRTIVIGGLNAGGKGYYALDVTNPASPRFLWEFTHTNLGLTFGNPVITKRADGTWIVAFTSGYNNNTNGGDGNGHLFILNAYTGAPITSIPTMLPDNTAAGDAINPSGLGKLNVWVDAVDNNTAQRFYAGDLKGNLWRFDLDGNVAPNGAALQLAKLTSPDGTAQSITTRPNLAEINYNGSTYPAVFVATGRYLGSTDAANTAVQSLYGIKDPLTGTGWGTVRTGNDLVPQTLSIGTNTSGLQTRVLDSQAVDWGTKAGWRLDFPGTGERVTVNPQLTINTLTVGTILPSSSVCTVGGESFLYRFDITTVGADNAVVGTYVGNVLIQGLTTVQLADGTIVTITTRSDATLQPDPTPPSLNPANLRRSSWRELAD